MTTIERRTIASRGSRRYGGIFSMKTTREWAADYDMKLRADDSRFDSSVTVSMADGTYMFLRNAFTEDIPLIGPDGERHVAVFTEHYGWFVLEESEITSLAVHKLIRSFQRCRL